MYDSNNDMNLWERIADTDVYKRQEQGTHNELMAYNGRYKDFQDVYYKANQWRLA